MALSTFSGNSAKFGGAISSGGILAVDQSTLIGNQASQSGGGIAFTNELTLTASTVRGNTAAEGGGISAEGNATYTNCTISGNESIAEGGGVFHHAGRAVMRFTTVANNNSASSVLGGHGAGIHMAVPTMSFQNTLLSSNSASNCGGESQNFVSLGHNLSRDTSCAAAFTQTGDKNGLDAKLGPLADNGGPTSTHLLLTGSPAIDAAVMITGITTDQRVIKRPQGANPDIGSVEAP
ncbi:MAG: choice-of-anchor Q domain-containing protein [Thermoanaerobaculia bacterium]